MKLFRYFNNFPLCGFKSQLFACGKIIYYHIFYSLFHPFYSNSIIVDGCSAPTFFFTLDTIARLYQTLSSGKYPELERAYNAMVSYPYNVAGKGHFDTKFMEALRGKGVTKGGGESVRGIAMRDRDGKNLGIALKVLDGNARAMPIATLKLLEHLDLLTKVELSKLDGFLKRDRKNCREKKIGQIEVYIEN